MNTLTTMLNAYINQSLELPEFSKQFIEFWNEIRIEQNKAIEEADIRESLTNLWNQYKAGKIDEIQYGMKWTEILSTLSSSVRIPPQSFVYSLGNELYTELIIHMEGDHLETQEIATPQEIREHCQTLLESINN